MTEITDKLLLQPFTDGDNPVLVLCSNVLYTPLTLQDAIRLRNAITTEIVRLQQPVIDKFHGNGNVSRI